MTAPSIARKTHTNSCYRQDWPLSRHEHRLGDVRLCPHGRIQVFSEIGVESSLQGPGTHYWRDLSPFWNPIDYRRAKAALGAAK